MRVVLVFPACCARHNRQQARFVVSAPLYRLCAQEHYQYYRNSALIFVEAMQERFERCSFAFHLSESVPAVDARALVAAASGRAVVRRYAFSRKRGAHWLLGAMRFRTLWEHDGPETVCTPVF